MQALFWIALAVVVYTYLGYGLLLLLFNYLFRRKKTVEGNPLPALTFIVPAYNEADVVAAKIANTLALRYPADKITYLFITDGSDDGTAEIVAGHPRIKLLHQAERKGKSAAINRAMLHVSTPVVVFSDANTLVEPNSLLHLVAPFADASVGGVSGEKRIAGSTASAVGAGERLYWQYESLLKQAAAGFYTIIGAAGELFAIRTTLFQPLKEDVILDDFFISAGVCLQGYRLAYAKQAVAVEASSLTLQEEQKRKVRISAGCYQALVRLRHLLNPFRRGRVAFQYISHRVLRWAVCPLLLPLLFIINFQLHQSNAGPVYSVLFWAQCTFYGLALAGSFFPSLRQKVSVLLVPSYFVFMVSAQYRGFLRFAAGRQPAAWEKVRRAAAVAPPDFSTRANRHKKLPLSNQ